MPGLTHLFRRCNTITSFGTQHKTVGSVGEKKDMDIFEDIMARNIPKIREYLKNGGKLDLKDEVELISFELIMIFSERIDAFAFSMYSRGS